MKRWILLILSILAVIALCLIIWYVFPVIGVAGVEPFANLWLRLALIVLLIGVFFGLLALSIYKHRKSVEELAANIVVQEPEDNNSDAAMLAEKMQDALITLKGSQRTRGDFLYELPWYLIIGPPGAGKTTALMNCGLKFPIAAHANGPVAGSGGTRYCDWWFTEDAVFIDTAGRYTTQDSDQETDRKSWLSFLDLLKKHRSRQPINGVMVAISVGDILGAPQSELASHAVAIRKRLAELNNRLQVDFPVYVVFTKADLISGFMEYFGHLDVEKRRAVWGATFQTRNKKENHVAEAGQEIDLLISRVSMELSDRLQEEPDPVSRVRLTAFASQIANLKPSITQFLNQIFEPTRYQTSATLRGFYFTSGTQEGTPIDRVLGGLARSLGMGSAVNSAYAGHAKSFFLENLLTKVIFGEAGWVSTNAAAVRRRFMLRTAAYTLLALLTAGTLGGWITSYFSNTKLIGKTNAAGASYAANNSTLINLDPIADTDFQKILAPLNDLRKFPRGYDTATVPVPVSETLGLGQHDRITVAASSAYSTALNRILRPRLVLHIERRLATLQDKPEQLYEPLKIYMMLSGDPTIPVDTALISGWMQGDWDQLYPGEPNSGTREDLRKHLDAMLDIEAGSFKPVPLNGDLVKSTQISLARLPLAQRAFALIRSTAHSAEIRDWTVVGHTGPDAPAVFTTNDKTPLQSVGVPALFTYDGFYGLFLIKVKTVINLLQSERWVLGETGGTENVDKQFAGLGPDMFTIYDEEFIKAWNAALNKLKLQNFAAGAPQYAALRAATGASSSIKLILESISVETKLTEGKPQPKTAGDKAKGVAANVAGQITSNTANDIKSRVESTLGASLGDMKEIGLSAAQKSDGRGGQVGKAFVPGALIQEHFRRYHELADTTGGKSQIDLLVEQMKGLYQSLIDEQKFEQATQARANQLQFMSGLSTSTSRLDPPFNEMFKKVMDEFQNKIVTQAETDLKGQLTGSVTRKCLDTITNKYPFASGSKADVPFAEFARLFGPNGVFDAFFKDKLVGLVDTSGKQWAWKQGSQLSQQLAPQALAQFQNASRIRDAFFTGQGTSPNVKFAIIMQSLSPQTPASTFEVNGTKLESPFGVQTRGDFEWPGRSPDSTASVSLPVNASGAPVTLQFTGPWALHRLLQAGALRQNGNKATVRFVLGGKEVSYQLTLDTLDNPFTLISQLGFSCPANL